MKQLLTILLLCPFVAATAADLRPPSVPLVAVDPYFSIWSPADKLTDAETVHWTGRKHPLHLIVRIDGQPFRLMGTEPKDVTAMPQTNLVVGPLMTEYTFENDLATITIAFITPFLPHDLTYMSRPVTYLTFSFKSKGNKKRDIDLYFDAGAEIAVNMPEQSVSKPTEMNVPNTKTLRVGSVDQNVLGKRGDDVRIDWGYLIVSALDVNPVLQGVSPRNGSLARAEFATTGTLQQELAEKDEYNVKESNLVLAVVWNKKQIIKTGGPLLILAYDDIQSVRYFGDDLQAYWKKDGKTTESMLEDAWKSLLSGEMGQRAQQFDQDFQTDLEAIGGKEYAQLCALAYRHSFAAQKIVADANGMPLMFSKENFSNGSMGTVDLMYPCSPLLLYYSPALQKATMQPIFDYAGTTKWKFPFAPHDIGTYPHGTGQTYGGGERSEENQMPVEESANMILQTAALAVAENNADYAKKHWGILTKWADYLLEKGFDPENQLCTDDFAGHLAHNVNLSAKAIVAIAAYAQLAEKLGEKETAQKYRKAAEEFAQRWVAEATEGEHTRLAFDRKGTWAMKYNLMWDSLLGLNLFPKSVIEKEIAYYKTKMQPFGLPLDNRSLYSKNDWILWIAAMTDNAEDFAAFVKPVHAYVSATENRVPLSDWYFTDSAKQVGFQARSVVGGFWAPMLKNTEKWQAQAAKGADVPVGDWAAITLPSPPLKIVVPTAETEKVSWKYTTAAPANGWEKPDFDDSAWKEGEAGFGRQDTPGAIVGTRWNSDDIWLRRLFDWDGEMPENAAFALNVHHDDAVQIFLNGKPVLKRSGYTTSYEIMRASLELKKGKNTLSVQCHQDQGGQFIDAGIVLIKKSK